ncbi:MAG: 50S ribosomal protein L6 [Chloroflexi bacterium]|nr:50S ribosomal protein L6 [Chloroflexota bacterium]MBI5053759.1 50S ribosomal protein L6 [Chloroflexota bacterium]MBI5081555.1 50S ribosomal protein L6 [Chloroflexota bacterium]MBI5713825.1 50S ribosomal protein L6 [Chloroflexota bacterium]
MSRIGRKAITLPKGVSVTLKDNEVKVKGPKGELTRTFRDEVKVKEDKGTLHVERSGDSRQVRALHGLTRALLNNMVTGVSNGFSKVLQVEGVGYRAELKGKDLVMALGFSHPVVVTPPTGISFAVDEKTRLITVSGPDKEQVGQVAAEVRAWRPPEPYKGKGLRYQGEVVRLKPGKAGKAA